MDLKHLELHDCNQNVGTKSFSLPQLMERQFQSLNVVSTCVCGGSSQVKTGEVKRVHDIGIPQKQRV